VKAPDPEEFGLTEYQYQDMRQHYLSSESWLDHVAKILEPFFYWVGCPAVLLAFFFDFDAAWIILVGFVVVFVMLAVLYAIKPMAQTRHSSSVILMGIYG